MQVIGHYGIGGADEFMIPLGVVSILASTAMVLVAMYHKARERSRRLDLIEAALRNPSLTPEAQRELVQSLRRPGTRAPFVLGWFGLFGGISWLCCKPRGDEFTTAIVITVLAAALVTLPFALRELEARKA
jgi:hypothetical protein